MKKKTAKEKEKHRQKKKTHKEKKNTRALSSNKITIIERLYLWSIAHTS